MIQYREWASKKPVDIVAWDRNMYKFQGWFLFGVIPLLIKRIGY
jgi:hypothetical protein